MKNQKEKWICWILWGILFSLEMVQAQWVWSQENGWSSAEFSSKSSAKNLFEEGENLFKNKQYSEALLVFTTLRENYPPSKYSEDILYYQGECFFHLNQYSKAHDVFYAYFLDYPNTKRLSHLMEREYKIGASFLEEEETEILGLTLVDAREEGIRILKTLIKIYPHSEFSDEALYKIANYYFTIEDFEEAEKHYKELLEKYLLSKWRPASMLQIAMTYRQRHRGTDYDEQWLKKAAHGFKQFLKTFPEDQQVPQAQEYLKEMNNLLARKLFETAAFYEKTGAKRAAIRYYELSLKRYPESDFAQKATQAIEDLK